MNSTQSETSCDITVLPVNLVTYALVAECLNLTLSCRSQNFVAQITDQWSPSSPCPFSPNALTSWLWDIGDWKWWLWRLRLVAKCCNLNVLPHLTGLLSKETSLIIFLRKQWRYNVLFKKKTPYTTIHCWLGTRYLFLLWLIQLINLKYRQLPDWVTI